MPLAPETEHALAACHAAALDSSLWPDALQKLGESVGARSCLVRAMGERHDPGAPRHIESREHRGFSELWLRRVDEAPDLHVPGPGSPARPLARRETVLFDQDLGREEDLARTPYFRAIARPGQREWWACASFDVAGELWALPLYRSARDGPFPPSQRDALAELGRRLAAVIGLAQEARRTADARVLETLGLLGLPVAALAADGAVLTLSEPAKALLGPHLSLARGQLVTPDPATTRRLRRLAQAAARPGAEGGTAVLFRDGEPWLAAEGWPLPAPTPARFEGARGAILFRSLRPRPGGRGRLAEAFGLTPAEARVAEAFAAGQTPRQIGEAAGLGRETVRTQLKAVFRKTGAHGQVRLASLLARLAV